MAESYEYYWDEETQSYWYWDEETQAYYAYEEENDTTAATSEGGEALTLQPDYKLEAEEIPDQPAQEIPDQPAQEPEPEEALEEQPALKRHLSFKNYGGLAGCVLQAVQMRRQSQEEHAEHAELSDAKIKLRNKLQMAREMAATSSDRRISDASTASGSTDSSDRPSSRRTTVRFGTEEFSNPAFQDKLNAMLGSTVKPR